jgi:hypothetical protein
MRSVFDKLIHSCRAVRPGRLAALLLAALAAGLLCDWLRPEQRLVLPRPLPVFTTTTPAP